MKQHKTLLILLCLSIFTTVPYQLESLAKTNETQTISPIVKQNAIKKKIAYDKTVIGKASWYGSRFHGRRTANGEYYDMHTLTAAHKKLAFDSLVKVTNLNNGESIVVRINDRGPYIKGRNIDLSYLAAQHLKMVDHGVIPVKLEILTNKKRFVYRHDYPNLVVGL